MQAKKILRNLRASLYIRDLKTMELSVINKEFEAFISKLPNEFNKEKIREAYNFSKKAHYSQRRTSGEPYISHPLEVSKLVFEFGLDEASIISAFLHDVVEDTQISLSIIEKQFGPEVKTIVDGLTKIYMFGESREKTRIESLKKVLFASVKDIRILIIKLCDRLHNMRTLEGVSPEKKERVADETFNIYVPLAQKIGIYSLKWELEDLTFKYKNPEMFQFIKDKIGLKREEREKIVKEAVEEIRHILNLSKMDNVVLLGRPKNFYSIYKKIREKAKRFDDIHDLYAVRVITKDVASCYIILGILHEKFHAYPDRLKDYIANPKANGYQSLHTVIFSRRIKMPLEVQIRTEEMHKFAEFGIAAHWKYKNLSEDKKFDKKITWLREFMQWENEHKDSQEFLKVLKFDFFQDEIFVFTPKHDMLTLPEGATALDFAYIIHSDIGDRAFKAKINGFISTLDKELKSGDIVEIVTRKDVVPSEKWLKVVKTAKARMKIRSSLNLKLSGKRNKEVETIPFEELKSKIIRAKEFKKIRKAGCCSFNYGEQIVGVVGKSKELVVHNASCENSKYAILKKIPLRWKVEKDKNVCLTIFLKDRFGVLIDILNLISEFNLNINKFSSKVNKDGSVKMEINLLDGPHIQKVIKKLKKLDFVDSVNESRSLFW